jgi:hypothetical protein
MAIFTTLISISFEKIESTLLLVLGSFSFDLQEKCFKKGPTHKTTTIIMKTKQQKRTNTQNNNNNNNNNNKNNIGSWGFTRITN